mmetsp:Transcript_510/g.1320  ORF Transcript_510/g.1320 Transcript_510/m.1320 type:complete len:87 (+) Transcript_510:670-930(+)
MRHELNAQDPELRCFALFFRRRITENLPHERSISVPVLLRGDDRGGSKFVSPIARVCELGDGKAVVINKAKVRAYCRYGLTPCSRM